MFKKDVFGHFIFIKSCLIRLIGIITFPGLNWFNKVKIIGMENLDKLPNTNVLFVSNHQTYFADVITFLHIFCSHKWGFRNKINNPIYLLRPKIDTYFIAAEETMKAGLLPKIFAYVGSVSIKRTWRAEGKDVNRQVDMSDISNIGKAIENGWVITFPQGTTKPFVPGRRGTAHLIKTYKTVVVPITISGFRFAFDKKGLKFKKRGVILKVNIKEPLEINFDDSSDKILEQLMDAIEQSEKFKPVNLKKAKLAKQNN
jgi:1-acyl-sn-glycerol-3-phosphate acyltransferase